MNKRDIELADKARFVSTATPPTQDEILQHFAELIRADEREACAKVCDAEARQFERNSDGAHDGRYDWKADGADDCAAGIRARGNT